MSRLEKVILGEGSEGKLNQSSVFGGIGQMTGLTFKKLFLIFERHPSLLFQIVFKRLNYFLPLKGSLNIMIDLSSCIPW